jgi:paraquat-inducible protein B
VIIEIDEDRLKRRGVTDIDLGDPTQVAQLVAEGLRAELATESFVTGVLYVSLDVRPDTPARLVHDPHYPEIPPARTARETIPANFDKLMMRLADVDFPGLADSLHATIEHVDRLVESPLISRTVERLDELTKHVDQLTMQLAGTAREMRPAVTGLKNAATAAGKALEPAGQLVNQVDSTLRELQLAARSVKRLSDQIARDPGAILRGGKQ